MIINFSAGDENTQQRQLARHMPEGAVWENKHNLDSNLGKLILGLASEYFRISVLIEDVLTETDVNQTNLLIKEWQVSVGIPDECLAENGSLEDQRRDIILKLSSFGGIQKAVSFEDLAAILGFSAALSNGSATGVFPLEFQTRFFDSRKTAVHTIIVDLIENKAVFPLDFPIQFTSTVSGIIECLFRELAPANVQLIFRYGA
ncbi:MAG: putative phage tail protein [Candidatus Anammoxibacter sp.]